MRLREFLLKQVGPGAHRTGAPHHKLVGERRAPALMRHVNQDTLGTKGIGQVIPSWDDDGEPLRQMAVANFQGFNKEPDPQLASESLEPIEYPITVPHQWQIRSDFGGDTLRKNMVACDGTNHVWTSKGSPSAAYTVSATTVMWWNSPVYDPADDDGPDCAALEGDASYVWLQEHDKAFEARAHIPTKDSEYPAVLVEGDWKLQAPAVSAIDACVLYDPDNFEFEASAAADDVDHSWVEDFAGTPVSEMADVSMVLEEHLVAKHENGSFMFQATGNVVRADEQESPFTLSWYPQAGTNRTTSRTLIQYTRDLDAERVYYSVNRDPAEVYGAIACPTAIETSFCIPGFGASDQDEFNFVRTEALQTFLVSEEKECVQWVGNGVDVALTVIRHLPSGSQAITAYLNTTAKNAPDPAYFGNPTSEDDVYLYYCGTAYSDVVVFAGLDDITLDFTWDFWYAEWFHDSCTGNSGSFFKTLGPCYVGFGSYPYSYTPNQYYVYTVDCNSYFADCECGRLSNYQYGGGPSPYYYSCGRTVFRDAAYSSHPTLDDYWDADFAYPADLSPGFITLNFRRPFCCGDNYQCSNYPTKTLWWEAESFGWYCYENSGYGGSWPNAGNFCNYYTDECPEYYYLYEGGLGVLLAAATFSLWLRIRCKTTNRELATRVGTIDAKGRVGLDTALSHFAHSRGYSYDKYTAPPDPYDYGEPHSYDPLYTGRIDNLLTVPMHALAIAQGMDEDEYNTFMANSEDWEIIGIRVRPLEDDYNFTYDYARCQGTPYSDGYSFYPSSPYLMYSSFYVGGLIHRIEVETS